MPETLATYAFLPWLRQGLASKINKADTLGNTDGDLLERTQLSVDLVVRETSKVDKATHDHVIHKDVQLIGPGDVQGIDQRAIIRTFPAADIPNFETNLLPYIEFYEEDFPWRFTPASPAIANDRQLRPWLALIVLKEKRDDLHQEGEFSLTTPAQGLPILNVSNVDIVNQIFPKHTETWAWAHVQMLHPLTAPGEVAASLRENPDHGFARLLCPRKLVKNTAYRAFLIPAFETGRLGGLGLDTATVPAQEPAWKTGAAANDGKPRPNDFPVYFSWQFSTGAEGDFETLVSILKPIEIKPEMGTLVMDVHHPGFGLDGMTSSSVLGFEGALKPPTFVTADFPVTPNDQDFTERLQEILNLSVDAKDTQTENGVNKATEVWNPFFEGSPVDDPIVTPPIYGQWHALVERLGENADVGLKWLETLNLDPRRRGAAGLGTQAIRDNQEDLMHRAWLQVDQINEANRKIREGILTREVAGRIYAKHLMTAPDDKFLLLTTPLQRLTKRNNALKTLRFEINDSRIPLAAQSAAFRKITRPQGNLSRVMEKTNLVEAGLQKQVLRNFNIGGETAAVGIAAANLKLSPASTTDTTTATNIIQAQGVLMTDTATLTARQAFGEMLKNIPANATTEQIRTQLNDMLAAGGPRQAQPAPKSGERGSNPPPGLGDLTPEAFGLLESFVQNFAGAQIEDGVSVLSFQTNSYETLFGKGANNKFNAGFVLKRDSERTDDRKLATITTVAQTENYLLGMEAIAENLQGFHMPTVASALPVSIANLRVDIQSKLHPRYTVDRQIRQSILVWENNQQVPLRMLKPVMQYPVFPEPVYVHARKMSQDYILPNVAKLPQDSITLMLSNQTFIESFMAGLNHEMARELLWREFPTDQRGSYFRQFWNAADNILESDPEKKLDILKMHLWNGDLGDNATRAGENLVLVVRGQLFIKYPNTVVYAQKAKYQIPMDLTKNPTQQRVLTEVQDETTVKFPIFSAQLEPDIFLFGFELGAVEARGERVYDPTLANTVNKNPGWFFVFKERPGQTKFGLDDYEDPINGTTMPPPALQDWTKLSWENLVAAPDDLLEYTLNFSKNLTTTDQPNPRWADNAADMASILLQNPVIFARHADEMIVDAS